QILEKDLDSTVSARLPVGISLRSQPNARGPLLICNPEILRPYPRNRFCRVRVRREHFSSPAQRASAAKCRKSLSEIRVAQAQRELKDACALLRACSPTAARQRFVRSALVRRH